MFHFKSSNWQNFSLPFYSIFCFLLWLPNLSGARKCTHGNYIYSRSSIYLELLFLFSAREEKLSGQHYMGINLSVSLFSMVKPCLFYLILQEKLIYRFITSDSYCIFNCVEFIYGSTVNWDVFLGRRGRHWPVREAENIKLNNFQQFCWPFETADISTNQFQEFPSFDIITSKCQTPNNEGFNKAF